MPERKHYLAAIVVLGATIYLSLYPFQWRSDLATSGPLIDYLKTWRTQPDSRGDFIANIVFYLPCGYSLFGCFHERVPPWWRLIIVALLGTALSVVMELSQFYIADRVDDIRDTYANTIGTLLGGGAAMILRTKRQEAWLGIFKRDLFASLLLAAFVTARLYPYVPVIDMHKYWHAVRPLLSFVLPSPDELFLRTVAWAAIYYILHVALDAQRARAAFCAVIALVFAGQILVVDQELRIGEVLGAMLALAIGVPLLRWLSRPALLLAPLFAVAVVIERLQPFQFAAATHSFGWVPFLSVVASTTEHGMVSMLEKSYLYGTLIWLLTQAGLSCPRATAVVALLLLLCSGAELYLPDRSAEITDAALALLLGGLMFVLRSSLSDRSPLALSVRRDTPRPARISADREDG